MKTMKKMVAILAVALMLCSVLPLSAFAADTETITVTATTGVLDGTASISWTGTNYEIVNYKDDSTTAIRTSDSDHFRVYVGNEFYVRGIDGALMSQVVIKCAGSSYLINDSKNVVSDGWTVAADGTTITYTAAEPSSELYISIGKQSRVTEVTITPATATNPDCNHDQYTCGDTCDVCGETFNHAFDNTCDNECNNCGAANDNWTDHAFDGDYDSACNVCGFAREVSFPAADSVLTIPEADAIGMGMSHDTTTPSKYYVTGVVESTVNTTYGNLYIQDDEGNKLYIYGSYSADGSVRFDAMAEKPEVGMTITVYGVICTYSNVSQMKNAWIVEMEGGCEHEYAYDCSTTCTLCGLELRPEAVCVNGSYACLDGLCTYCGNAVAGLGHDFDDQWDPDCNYGCGETREVEERPEMTEATITFDADKTQRTEYSTSIQVWENGGLKLTNNKASSTSNVGDYSNPGRFYKSSEVIIEFSGMTSLVIDCSNTGDAKYSTPWGDMLTAAGYTYTVEEKIYTITFADPTDSITLTCAAQVRANSITAIAAKQGGEDECEHVYFDACSAICEICGAEREVSHNIVHVAAVAPTCVALGNIEYWYCDVCGMAWLNADCTLNTNLKAVVLPATGEHVYDNACDAACNVCGEIRKVTEATITFDADRTQRTEYSTSIQVWENDGLKLTNNKAGSTSNVGDYSNPIRFYKSSEVIIEFPGMTSLVIDANGISYSGDWKATLSAYSYTMANNVYTITFADPTDSITLTCAAQVRANSITAIAGNHVFDNTCDCDCNLCGVTRIAPHDYNNACDRDCNLCGAIRTAPHEYDSDCDNACNLCGTKRKAADHTYTNACDADCDVCGTIREPIHVYSDTCDRDCNACDAFREPPHSYTHLYDEECDVCGEWREVVVMHGDANGDGAVNARDAALLQQFVAGWEATLIEVSADFNGDGSVNARDAAILQQYVAGWDVTLG